MELTFKIIAVLAAVDFTAVACLLTYRAINRFKQRARSKQLDAEWQSKRFEYMQDSINTLEHEVRLLNVNLSHQTASKRKRK